MKKRALISAIAMLVVSAIVLTSATFAWFSMGKTVGVDSFNVGVSEADGLLISAYADKDFATKVTLDQIRTAADASTSIPSEGAVVSPVSSDGSGTFIGGFINEENELETAVADAGSYYAFPVYIKYSGAAAATVNLDGSSVTAGSGSKGTDAYKAVRVATDKSSYVCAPNSTDGSFKYVPSVGAGEQSFTNVKTSFADTMLSFTLQPGQITKVMVYVWLEGTDSSCTDDLAAGGDFNVELKFNKA